MLKDFVIDDDSVGLRAQGRYVDLHNEFDLTNIRLNVRERSAELEFARISSTPGNSPVIQVFLKFLDVDWLQISSGVLSGNGEVLELGYKEPPDNNNDWLAREGQASADAHFFLRLPKDEFVRIHASRATVTLKSGDGWLLRACSELGLRVNVGYTATLPDGRQISTIARVVDLGAPKGMLVVRGYDDIRESSNALVAEGYAYSVVDAPGPTEQFDLASYREMFRDWGWCGDPDKKPDWM